MSLGMCLPGLERSGSFDAGRSKEAQDLYDELLRFYARSHGPDAAASLASHKTIERLEAAAAHKRRNALRQARTQASIVARARGYGGADPMAGGAIDPRGVEAMFGYDERAGHNQNVESVHNGIKSRVHAMIDDVLFHHRSKLNGKHRDQAGIDDIQREIFAPGSSGNETAAGFAQSLTAGFEYLRARFNEAGGQIGKIAGWLPQAHNARLVREAGFEEWRNVTVPLLGREKMIDRATGEPFTDGALELALRDVHETIRSEGMNKASAGVAGGKMLANSRADHRFLHFKDGDAWMAYAERFGSANAYDAMMGHIEHMSRDIALMEVLGPNPPATVRWLKDEIRRSAATASATDSKAIARADTGATDVQRLFDEVTGANRKPYREDLALAFGALRSFQVAAKLGGATLSAITDLGPAWNTLRGNGLSRIEAGHYLVNLVKTLNPASAEDRRAAVRLGLIADEWAQVTAINARYLAEDFSSERAKHLAAGVLRLSGLEGWTQGGRWAHGMTMLGHLTDQRDKAFAALDLDLQSNMRSHGIGPETWDAIRAAPLDTQRGTEWINPTKIPDQAAGDKLLAMLNTERDYAVPMPDLRTREAFNRFGGERGTWIGEGKRSMALFKSFSFAVTRMHGRRSINRGLVRGGQYAASLLVSMTLLGAAALQLKEISKGNDPRDMDSLEFWGAAVLQGGGIGIFGDLLSASENRVGGGLAQTIAGPAADTLQSVGNLTVGNATKAALGKKTTVGGDLVKLIKREIPGGSLWYTRLAFERLVADQLQEEMDPNYRDSWRKMERRAKERGSDFYWRPGDTAPERAPDLDVTAHD